MQWIRAAPCGHFDATTRAGRAKKFAYRIAWLLQELLHEVGSRVCLDAYHSLLIETLGFSGHDGFNGILEPFCSVVLPTVFNVIP